MFGILKTPPGLDAGVCVGDISIRFETKKTVLVLMKRANGQENKKTGEAAFVNREYVSLSVRYFHVS